MHLPLSYRYNGSPLAPFKIDDAFHQLSDNPAQGRNCDHIREGYRKYGIGKHYIFYRTIAPAQIEIVRILHGSMNIEERLGEN
ncbi:MAG: type II toxin-antitoxin system RelE/ParE family toxin [Symploca sp. SIO2E6]|nr:type II toxin-antitoxin system RelE/ParE family toxin [Symploca sp. SIO2E6]